MFDFILTILVIVLFVKVFSLSGEVEYLAQKMSKLTMLTILDGFGINEKEEGNAVKQANIPHLRSILTENPNTIIHTSGLAVGLPEGQMGNSEVGHTNIGAGRIVYQELTRITTL